MLKKILLSVVIITAFLKLTEAAVSAGKNNKQQALAVLSEEKQPLPHHTANHLIQFTSLPQGDENPQPSSSFHPQRTTAKESIVPTLKRKREKNSEPKIRQHKDRSIEKKAKIKKSPKTIESYVKRSNDMLKAISDLIKSGEKISVIKLAEKLGRSKKSFSRILHRLTYLCAKKVIPKDIFEKIYTPTEKTAIKTQNFATLIKTYPQASKEEILNKYSDNYNTSLNATKWTFYLDLARINGAITQEEYDRYPTKRAEINGINLLVSPFMTGDLNQATTLQENTPPRKKRTQKRKIIVGETLEEKAEQEQQTVEKKQVDQNSLSLDEEWQKLQNHIAKQGTSGQPIYRMPVRWGRPFWGQNNTTPITQELNNRTPPSALSQLEALFFPSSLQSSDTPQNSNENEHSGVSPIQPVEESLTHQQFALPRWENLFDPDPVEQYLDSRLEQRNNENGAFQISNPYSTQTQQVIPEGNESRNSTPLHFNHTRHQALPTFGQNIIEAKETSHAGKESFSEIPTYGQVPSSKKSTSRQMTMKEWQAHVQRYVDASNLPTQEEAPLVPPPSRPIQTRESSSNYYVALPSQHPQPTMISSILLEPNNDSPSLSHGLPMLDQGASGLQNYLDFSQNSTASYHPQNSRAAAPPPLVKNPSFRDF